MKVITGTGAIDLGTTETTPTIGITDYSVRTTDEFGVTTVVPRGFSRTLATRMLVDTDDVSSLQATLADLRGTTAQWVADDRFAWLSVDGFFKDFSIELALPTISYCTLTIEGAAETETGVDPGGDPAPAGTVSTLQMIQPAAITDAVLASSSVPEADANEWSAGISYAAGVEVMRSSVHRTYQSLSVHNNGNAPETSPAVWLDLGPTNRWAMFDQALGTATTANGQIVVSFTAPAPITGLAVLDTDAASVRVQAPGFDDAVPRSDAGTIIFTDLTVATGATLTVTINAAGGAAVNRTWNDGAAWSDPYDWRDSDPGVGTGPVSVGTMLFGNLVSLGITEASPTAGIIDYSLKSVDAFGEVTIVQRAWSKQMTAAALIDTAAVDMVASRIAAVRATPALWLGQAGLDVLTIYGFFKDFSIVVSETTSKLALTIEGLSKAAKVDPLKIGWSNVTDDDGNLPQAGATRNVPRGEWSPTVAYSQGDIVTYQGSSYIAGQNVPIGTYPTDAEYWDPLAEGGESGIPGPAGKDGTPSYIHVAYASSADGSQGFVKGIANPGLPFIGIYTDTTSAGSGDYHAYFWSRLTGLDGVNGTNGTPGPIGPDGRQSYVHFAYSDSADGTVNFTAGAPGTRTYLGVYSDYTEADSNDPSLYAWSLIKGPQGIPGPPAADGSAAFVHIAYANSADGSQDFIAGVANPGRAYIGIYTDGYSAGSTDYHSYNWSRLTGQNGLNGSNGTPGPVGSDGRQSYVHFAYADSINGQVNFTSGDPGSRSFIGVYSDFTVADSNDPNAYAWSLIRGVDGSVGPPGSSGTNGVDGLSALNIHTVGAVSWDGHNLFCTSPANSWTVNGAYSGNVIPGGVSLTFQRPNNFGNEDAFVGITQQPSAAIDYPKIDCAWRMVQTGSNYTAEVWHAGTQIFVEGWDGGNTYSVRYDANTGITTWYRFNSSGAGGAVAAYNSGVGLSFGFEATAARNMSVTNVAFTAAGGTGATGSAGSPGSPGTAGSGGPPGPPGTSGVSPAPKYVPLLLNTPVSSPTDTAYSSNIPLDNGATLTMEAYAFVGASYNSGGPANVTFGLELSFSQGSSWQQYGSANSGDVYNGDGVDLDATASYTNTSGGRQIVLARVRVYRTAQRGFSLGNSFFQLGGG